MVINWQMIRAVALAAVTFGVSVLIARYGASKKRQGQEGEKLKQHDRAVKVIEKDRELQKDANKIQETIDSRRKSDRSGLLYYAATGDKPGDAREEDNASA